MESSLLREILVPSLHAFVRLFDVSFLGSIRLFKMSMQALELPYWHEDGGRRGWKEVLYGLDRLSASLGVWVRLMGVGRGRE